MFAAAEWDEALTLLARAIHNHERDEEPDELRLAVCIRRLAAVHQASGDCTRPDSLMQVVETLQVSSLGKDALPLASTLGGDASFDCQCGRFEDAAVGLELAMQIFERRLGPEHVYVAVMSHNIGKVRATQDRLLEAEPYYAQALDILRRKYGPVSGPVQVAVENYCDVLEGLGKQALADSLQRASRATRFRAMLGDEP